MPGSGAEGNMSRRLHEQQYVLDEFKAAPPAHTVMESFSTVKEFEEKNTPRLLAARKYPALVRSGVAEHWDATAKSCSAAALCDNYGDIPFNVGAEKQLTLKE